MKIIVITLVLFFAGAGLLVYQNASLGEVISEVKLTGVTKKQAIENVENLPEVEEYLKNVPNGKVEVDNELEGEYNVHVYEIKDGHTATFNWYTVNIKSGEVKKEF